MKRIVVLLVAILMLAVAFAGCAEQNETPESQAPASESSVAEPSVAESSAAEPSEAASAVDPAEYLKGKTIRVVIGSTSVTGDTYLTAETVTRMIAEKYGCDIKCDPIGSNKALEEIVTTQPDGTTIMGFHDSTYLSVLFGAVAEDYKLENMVIGGSYGYNPGDCFAAKADAPYNTIKEMADWMDANPDETVRLAVEAGGVSNLGFNGIYVWIKNTYGEDVASRLKAFVTGSTDEKLQALWDGNCQGIYAAASSIEQYTEEGVDAQLKVKIIGLMGDKVEGKDWVTFADQGITMGDKPFSFTKEYYLFYPKDIPAEYVQAMDAALKAVCESDEYKAAIEKLGYKAQYLSSADATAEIYAKRDAYAMIIAESPIFDDLVG